MNTCDTCKWWVGKNFSVGERECQKLSESFSNKGFLDCTTGDESDPFITTKANFGCILWELKGDREVRGDSRGNGG